MQIQAVPNKENPSNITLLVAKIPDLDPFTHVLLAPLHLVPGFLDSFLTFGPINCFFLVVVVVFLTLAHSTLFYTHATD